MAIVYKDLNALSFAGFIEQEKKRLRQPIDVPEYAVSVERKLAELLENLYHINPGKINLVMTTYQRYVYADCMEQGGARITYQYNPALYQGLKEVMDALNIYDCALFKMNKREMSFNACAIGFYNRTLVFIGDAVANAKLFSTAQQKFIIGHEIGHLKCNHSIIAIMRNEKEYKQVIRMIPEAGKLERFMASLGWSRNSRMDEYSSDRAGLIACGSLEAACQALLKIHVPDEMDRVAGINLDQYLKQAEERVMKRTEDWGSHPDLDRRLVALQYFHSSRLYGRMTGAQVKPDALSDVELEKRMERIML